VDYLYIVKKDKNWIEDVVGLVKLLMIWNYAQELLMEQYMIKN
jgi:hypothetical protein